MGKNKILKVTIEYDNETYVAEGKDAESWSEYVGQLSGLAFAHGYKGWNQWTRIEKKGKETING